METVLVSREHAEMLRRLAVLETKIDGLSTQISSVAAIQAHHDKWVDLAESRIRDVEHHAVKSRTVNAVLAVLISAAISITPVIIRSSS